MNERVIIVEDEPDLAELIALHLGREKLVVSTYADGLEALAAIERERPDLVVLDVMLPGLDGHELCRRIRASRELSATPVLMLTARSEEADMVAGLELGADDYVAKPFSPRELVARVRGLLRRVRREPREREVLRFGNIEVDAGRHETRVEGELRELTHTEFRILQLLLTDPGRVRSRTDILRALGDAAVLERTVDAHIASLRRKLGPAGECVRTVRGVGYRAGEP